MKINGSRLKELRKKKKISQRELGELIGVQNLNTVSRWENEKNEPSDYYFDALCRYFGVSYAYLSGLSDDPHEVFQIEEEEANRVKQEKEEDEKRILTLYRVLSPEMQRMILNVVNQAYIVDHSRGALNLEKST